MEKLDKTRNAISAQKCSPAPVDDLPTLRHLPLHLKWNGMFRLFESFYGAPISALAQWTYTCLFFRHCCKYTTAINASKNPFLRNSNDGVTRLERYCDSCVEKQFTSV